MTRFKVGLAMVIFVCTIALGHLLNDWMLTLCLLIGSGMVIGALGESK